jgi:hypothetical protein
VQKEEAVKTFVNYLRSLFVRHDPAYDEAYLAEAVDIYDLERRIRELDRRHEHNTFYPAT